MTVRMTHPDLPGQPYFADDGQVPHLRAAGWVVAPPPAEPEGDGLEDLTVAELQDRLRVAGLPVSGAKAELLQRLREVSQQAGVEPAPEEAEG